MGRYRIVDEATSNENETIKKNLSVGIERVFKKDLTGVDGQRTYEISADGVRIPVTKEEATDVENGKNVRLTINQDIIPSSSK